MSCLKRVILFSLVMPSILFAQSHSMKSNFDEGRSVGKSENQTAQKSIQELNARDIAPIGTPQEASLYTGQDANPQLNSMGIQALQSSEIGQILTTSSVNNPADNISPESDMIKRSDEIVKNSNFLTGGIGGKQCIKQTLSKSHFTNHYCEKDQQINKICKKTAEIKWSGSKSYENKEYSFVIQTPRGIHEFYNKYGFTQEVKESITIPEKGTITGFAIWAPYDGGGYYGHFHKNRMPVIFLGNHYELTMQHNNFLKDNLSFPYSYRDMLLEQLVISSVNVNKNEKIPITIKPGAFFLTRSALRTRARTFHIKIFMITEKDDLKAEIEWVNSCEKTNLDNAISLGEQCIQKGETRNFFKDGKNVALHSDCWEKQTEYLISDSSDNECKKYDDNPNCSVGERECISSLGELCNRFRLKYQCQHTTKADGVVCGDKFFCSDGSCSDLENSKNTQFGHAVSQLASLAQAGKDISLDNQNLRAFSGRPMACRKSGFGFSDCCKDSGWGHKAGLAHCNSEESVLGKAKEKNVVIYVGTYCDKRVLKKCVRRKSSYCVFDNKLARIVQYQGRSGQLGVWFGDAKNPDCRGITVDELQRINFNAIDYSDFYSDLESNTQMPNQDKIIDYIKNNISSQLQQ